MEYNCSKRINKNNFGLGKVLIVLFKYFSEINSDH